MTLKEMKLKVLALIEELNVDTTKLTEDPDIAAKINDVINQVMFELARIKKIPKYFEMEVSKGDVIRFVDLEKKCGNEIYQVSVLTGVKHLPKANGTVFKVTEDGIMEVDCFVYPERITDKTQDSYEFELTPDVLEIMPYGVASDLLKSDISTEYGSIYATRYESMKQMLDPRYATAFITFEGGVKI